MNSFDIIVYILLSISLPIVIKELICLFKLCYEYGASLILWIHLYVVYNQILLFSTCIPFHQVKMIKIRLSWRSIYFELCHFSNICQQIIKFYCMDINAEFTCTLSVNSKWLYLGYQTHFSRFLSISLILSNYCVVLFLR